MIGFLGLAALAFASTDVDDLFLLVALFTDRNLRRRDVVAGQFVGMAVLFCLSILGSWTAWMVPGAWIRLLGWIPLGMGLWKLGTLRKGGQSAPQSPGRGVATVLTVTLAGGGDNLGAWIPLFAAQSALRIALAGLLFAALTAVWCLGAAWLVDRPALRPPLQRHGRWIAPLALIALGLTLLAVSARH